MKSEPLLSKINDDSTHLLLSLLAEDDAHAFQQLFKRYQSKVYKVSLLYVKDTVQAEEIVQDIFLKIWLNRKNITSVNSFESWLFIMTKNHTLSILKKQASERLAKNNWGSLVEPSEQSVESEYIYAEHQKMMLNAISNLPAQQQLVYKMAKEQGLSYEAIGNKLSLSPLTVKTHMARALSALRSFAKSHIGFFMIAIITLFKNI